MSPFPMTNVPADTTTNFLVAKRLRDDCSPIGRLAWKGAAAVPPTFEPFPPELFDKSPRSLNATVPGSTARHVR
jgi:hypothetical protein